MSEHKPKIDDLERLSNKLNQELENNKALTRQVSLLTRQLKEANQRVAFLSAHADALGRLLKSKLENEP